MRELTSEFVVQTDNAEVGVDLVGNLQTREQKSDLEAPCPLRIEARPELACRFFDVNLDRGGIFKASDETDFSNGPDDYKNFECTLTLGPLGVKGPLPEPGPVGGRLPGADPRRR